MTTPSRRTPFSFLSALLFLLFLSPAVPVFADQAAAGEVVFVVGEAMLERAGVSQPLHKGVVVREGDWVRTGADGHAHLRMHDQGFIAVRPGSRLQLRYYAYHPENPAANRVQLNLESGVARTVSGKAGETSKERYRFNTPLAAIGLRGTDYVVHSAADATRVSVLRGEVVVSPLGDGCRADAFGPCGDALARALVAHNPHAYLEVRINADTPEVRLIENGPNAPDRSAPARPEEPRALIEDAHTAVRLAESLVPTPAVAPPEIVWGRWQHVALATPTVVSLLSPAREVTYANDLFALLRPAGPVSLPQGTVSLKQVGGEAWLRGTQGQLDAVGLSAGHLTLDFNKRQFHTGLTAHTGDDLPLALQAQGKITFQGNLVADPERSNMNLAGAISDQAREAGYVFDRQLPDGTLLGVTHWKR